MLVAAAVAIAISISISISVAIAIPQFHAKPHRSVRNVERPAQLAHSYL